MFGNCQIPAKSWVGCIIVLIEIPTYNHVPTYFTQLLAWVWYISVQILFMIIILDIYILIWRNSCSTHNHQATITLCSVNQRSGNSIVHTQGEGVQNLIMLLISTAVHVLSIIAWPEYNRIAKEEVYLHLYVAFVFKMVACTAI